MISKSGKPWRNLRGAARQVRLKKIMAALERRRQNEPIPKTTSEWWKSTGYLKRATIFAYSILEERRPEQTG
jgi:hypothetical protein